VHLAIIDAELVGAGLAGGLANESLANEIDAIRDKAIVFRAAVSFIFNLRVRRFEEVMRVSV
jgi:hypothetical protein